MKQTGFIIFFALFSLVFAFCRPGDEIVIKIFPCDSIEGVVDMDIITFDKECSFDGKGSLAITTEKPVIVNLYETGDIDIEDTTLFYRASIKTEEVENGAYLMMLLSFKGKGEFFSKGLDNIKTGTNDWSMMQIPFFLKKGENPDNVKIQIVINGKGKVWIDNVELFVPKK